ncbi:hypothetical protein BGZ57DRAFT_992721 [Hyaloscypha finlandica]|nr:hypothetical protein BGZ57DRAFT_992721 [Hyaloscypha finlandica]
MVRGLEDGDGFPSESSSLLPRSTKDDHKNARRGFVTLWAAFGLIWVLTAVQAVIRWIFSSDFSPAPVLGPDAYPLFRMIGLRVLEVASVGVVLGFAYFCVIAPLWTTNTTLDGPAKQYTGRLSLDGKFVIGGIVAWITDGFLNCREYLFAWNAHSVNMGVWTRFLPFHNPHGPTQYAEGLLWGMPMYVYFCAGVAIVACEVVVKPLRKRWPGVTDAQLFVVIWVCEFVFDFVVENTIIRGTHAYSFPKTFGPLTLWKGEVHQFPIYESVFVATLGSAYTRARMDAIEDPKGLSPVEKGYERWPKILQAPVRALAVIGFCAAATILIYHLPLNWLGLIGDSTSRLPSYMRPGSDRDQILS